LYIHRGNIELKSNELESVNEYDVNVNKPCTLRNIFIKHAGEEVASFLSPFFSFYSNDCVIFNTGDYLNVEFHDRRICEIINLEKVNNVRYINKFFEASNTKLLDNGYIAGRVETYSQRRRRILKNRNKLVSYTHYFLDFVLNRVFPKWKPTRSVYFMITKGRNRVISRAELYGRLYSCGFTFIAERVIDNYLYYIFQKKSLPTYDKEPTYGPFINLRRIGKDGKIIKVYKLRTMYAFSEYLQQFVYERNKLEIGGKFKNDFRVTQWGMLLRRLWLDELPMLYNLIKGDMKLVGVRPLSKHYFSLYSEDARKRRIKYKPGLIPPMIVDMPKTIDEIQKSEIDYFDKYDKRPFWTDFKYFFLVFYSIIVKRIRSA